MKDLEKSLGQGSTKLTREQRRRMKELFETQILMAVLLRGRISPDRYEKLVKKRVR